MSVYKNQYSIILAKFDQALPNLVLLSFSQKTKLKHKNYIKTYILFWTQIMIWDLFTNIIYFNCKYMLLLLRHVNV